MYVLPVVLICTLGRLPVTTSLAILHRGTLSGAYRHDLPTCHKATSAGLRFKQEAALTEVAMVSGDMESVGLSAPVGLGSEQVLHGDVFQGQVGIPVEGDVQAVGLEAPSHKAVCVA